jgi:hypothetical protein
MFSSGSGHICLTRSLNCRMLFPGNDGVMPRSVGELPVAVRKSIQTPGMQRNSLKGCLPWVIRNLSHQRCSSEITKGNILPTSYDTVGITCATFK